MKNTSSCPKKAHGFSLLEVMLALALFASAGVMLVTTINEIGEITLQARILRNVEQGMESLLDEHSKMPQMVEGEKDYKAGADGVVYRVEVRQLDDVKNQDNEILANLFGIKVIAKWEDNGKPLEMSAETIRYAGMFLPQ
jgi:prepilin-type N-terminal cleavage/methylation domain-containing protein